MRKIILIIICLFSQFTLFSQELELEIDYIAHDHFNEAILNAVDEIFQTNAYSKTRHTYLYLANAESPIVLKCSSNNQKQYEDFRYTINSQLKHNVWPEVDIQRILDLLKEDDFIDDSGAARYGFFTINFYITPSFWSYNYNETLIARLFWDLDLAGKTNFQVNIYHPENDGFKYDEEHMFGPKKLNGDYKVYMYTYKN